MTADYRALFEGTHKGFTHFIAEIMIALGDDPDWSFSTSQLADRVRRLRTAAVDVLAYIDDVHPAVAVDHRIAALREEIE